MKISVKVYARPWRRLFIWPEEERRSWTTFIRHMLDRIECSSRQIGIREVSRCMCGETTNAVAIPPFQPSSRRMELSGGVQFAC
jgi:hypothetical protein